MNVLHKLRVYSHFEFEGSDQIFETLITLLKMVAKTRAALKQALTTGKLDAPFDDAKVTKRVITKKITLKRVSLTSSPKTPVTPTTPSKSKSPRKSPSKRIEFEDFVQHVLVPSDFLLPLEFEEYHTEDFISGIKHVIKLDPSLYKSIVHKPFTAYDKAAVEANKNSTANRITTYWYNLVSSVISQQVSGASARAIEGKFRLLFGEQDPTPQITLEKSYDELRSAGLSNQKTKYIQHISEVFNDPTQNLTNLEFYKLPLPIVIEELVKLKGIGEWSAKMFAIFTLRELDVFAYDDLGVARGISRYLLRRPELLAEIKEEVNAEEHLRLLLKKKSKFDKKDSKRDWVPYHDEYVKHAGKRFSPYQSVFMLIMWRLASTNIEVLENTGIQQKELKE